MLLDFLRENWRSILLTLNYILVAAAGVTILLDNRNPSKTYAYLLLLVFVPIAGLVVFYFFGRDLRKKKVIDHKSFLENKQVKAWSKELAKVFARKEDEIEATLGPDWMKVARMLMRNEEIRALPSLHNKVTVLTNGEGKFPVLLEELAKAESHIHLEYYIFADNAICKDIQKILVEKAQAGVKVRFIYDAMGASMGRDFIDELKEAGVDMYAFLPVKFHKLADKVNYRDHRKIVIIDGKVGFTGGINIDDRYNNKVKNEIYWRDTHLMIQGEAVRNLQLYFLLHWHFVSEERLPIDPSIFPDYKVRTKTAVQIIGCGPDNFFPAIEHVFLMAINQAKESVYVTTPYFIPTEQVATALETAALSGVEVNLIIPEKADHQLVQSATCSYLTPLLRAGVNVYLYKKGFIHAKVMIVDDFFSTVGTCNLDTRSFLINWEINAVVYDRGVNRRLLEDMQADLRHCRKVTLKEWEARGNVRKVVESVCRVISPIL